MPTIAHYPDLHPIISAVKMHLIVGKQDHYRYENAVLFNEQAKKYPENNVKLITHDGGHVISENIVRQVIHDLDKSAEVSNE